MIERNYYYLVAGLPDILIEQSKSLITQADLKAELKQHLHPADYHLVELLFMQSDNRNLLNMLLKKVDEFDTLGNFSFDELEEGIKEPELLPSYMGDFVLRFKNNNPLDPDISWENQLTSLYYNHVLESRNAFLKQWFSFEQNIRNVLIAFTARKHKLRFDVQLVGTGDTIESIKKSNARDLGLINEFPLVEKILQIYESPSLLDREKSLDIVRWNFIDELNTFNYFTIEVILGFVIKLGIVERWMKLDKKTGENLFRQFLSDLESSYEFPKEFRI